LTDKKDLLIKLADRLLEKEVIFREDLEEIFGIRPFDEEVPTVKKEVKVEVANEVAVESTEVKVENNNNQDSKESISGS
jgi:cell division protease FtsH